MKPSRIKSEVLFILEGAPHFVETCTIDKTVFDVAERHERTGKVFRRTKAIYFPIDLISDKPICCMLLREQRITFQKGEDGKLNSKIVEGWTFIKSGAQRSWFYEDRMKAIAMAQRFIRKQREREN